MTDKNGLPKNNSVLGTSGLNAKTITGVAVYQAGSVMVIEVSYSGGSQFIKIQGFRAEVGGTNEWGTGTQVL
jgi:hypothetical protein